MGSGAQLIVKVGHVVGHSTCDISSGNVYWLNIVIVQVEVLVVFGRLE